MSILKRLQYMLGRPRMGEFIPVVSYDEKRRLFGLRRDASELESPIMDYAAGWFGIPSSGLDRQMVSDLEELFRLDYPPDTLIQIQRVATTKVDSTIRTFLREKELSLTTGAKQLTSEQRKVLLSQARARADFLYEGKVRPLIRNTSHKLKEELVFVTVRVPKKARINEMELEKLRSLFDRVESQLQKLHIRPKRIEPQGYLEVINSLLRMNGKEPTPKYDPERPINEQATHSEDYMRLSEQACEVNGTFVASASAHAYPEHHHLRNMLAVFGDVTGSTRQLNEPYMATLSVIIPDQVKGKDRYVASKAWIDNFTEKGTLHKKFSRLRHKKRQFEIMEQALGIDGVYCDIWMNFQTFAPTEEAAVEEIQNFKTIARGYGWDFRADKHMHGPFFLQSLPMCGSVQLKEALVRHQQKAGQHAAHVSPIIGEWPGNAAHPIQLYVSRRGSLISLNNWESSVGYNGIVSASTGAGKSFFIQDFAVNNLAHGVKVSLIDKGRSFLKMVEEMDGQYFDFIEPGKYNLNPYRLVKNIDEETEQLSIIFQTMADPNAGLDNFQRPRLTDIVRKGWEAHGADCSVDWVAEKCLQDSERRVKDMGEMLAGYCSNGQHGAWFNTGESLTFGSNMLTGIELSGLDNKPSLQAVVLQMVLMELQRIMYQEDLEGSGQRSMTIIDEAADLLQLAGPAAFAERMYRQARKYRSAVWAVTQLLSDFRGRIPTGEALLGNTAFKILLNQKAEVIRELKTQNWAGLSEYEIAMLENVHTHAGRYSEALFITPQGSGVGRLVLPRAAQLLYTTDPGEKSAIKRLKDQGMSTAAAIERLVEEEKKASTVEHQAGLQQRRSA